MKIFNDPKTPGLISDKNETQNRVSKKQGPEKNAPVLPAADELALTSRKAPPAPQMREIENANTAAVEFDVSAVPMMKMKLASLNNYILSHTAEALSAQANLSADTVAGLIG